MQLSLLSLLSMHSRAFAWDSTGATWPADAFPVPYWVQEDLGFTAQGRTWSDEEVLAAVQAGFSTWEAVACAGIRFAYQGRVDGSGWGVQDGRNVVYFMETSWPEDAGLLTTPTIFTAGSDLVEVDMALNLADYAWTLDGADGVSSFDVQAGVVHESGHLLGLWHSTVTGASLNPAMDGNPEGRSLEDDDIEGLCTLYDGSAGEGEAELGEDCVTSADCAAGLDCLVDGDERYCSQACTGDSDCPADMECLALGTGEQVCARSTVQGGCGCASGAAPGGLLGLALGVLGFAARRQKP